MDTIEKQLHLASQYLAAAGISFLPKAEDDSHTNLGFNAKGGYLETHPLSDNNDKLVLNYKNFSLEWKSNSELKTFKLDGATHKDAVDWISKTSRALINKAYSYQFHYELPYAINDTSTYKLVGAEKLNELMQLRIIAQSILESVNNAYHLNASIRVWPHHFDTGIYSQLPDSDISIGLGLAIPDTICDNHYFYITGYKNGNALETLDLSSLSIGEWKSEGFTGAILNSNNILESIGVAFFNEAIKHLKSA